jgi:hypothetical protein
VEEIAPGIHHWTAVHPDIEIRVHSYLHAPSGALIDPLVPEEGIDVLAGHDPKVILLTNRLHRRSSVELSRAFGCPIRVSREGLHDYADVPDVEPFDPGDVLDGGIEVHPVGAICPDEVALRLPDVEALACADGVIRFPDDAELGFVPDFLIGDDAEGVKAGLLAAYRELAGLEFRHLLLAHGNPVVGDGREALARFAAG